ncbi:D-alanyl-D-alanine carboxypeptidase (penicillin-binding protein 5/6) [Sphingobium wenxiniae]|uniref:serine-type D-Ala-D-Ala carboxypeptidase n=1 Tax=Sphingobium wenxiniae (strain DSM 21828 / CGMCC 1.7748 / JZ-1) TaxID=595605 RepID=A0A562KPU5_SPHWJ|nr:D-alanyl-D-alanine carboxypeptidase family protein [Sphingobium wenxiniae]MBB6190236.1 D-alanyl-D-alanine carboxypeptidase (penicillin-binding protein 5/6) [Sphingobium wenxiniae]TWH97449.1 D-alanyl-D-alanine carboxypeptidase (penicillin-binding protein 5/6) [Sphingobium wenxiniae]
MNKSVAAILFVGLLASPLTAAAPPYTSEAPIAYLKDLSSGAVLYDKGGETRIPPASMAKMMTAHVAFRMIQKGELKLDTKFTVRPETWQRWHGPQAGSTMFLSVGEQVSVENLLHGIVTLSGNDACVVLAEGIAGTEQAFVALMNQEGERLGLKNSHFGTSNGWPDEGVTYVTAEDLARLAQATIEETPDLYKKFYATKSFTWGKTMGGQDIEQANRNPILGKIAGADGLKTGHTQEAGFGFTGSAEQDGRRLVMVVAGLPTFNGRIAESVRFMDWGFKAWKVQPLFRKGQTVETAEVQLGSATSVPLVAPQNLAVTLPRTASTNISVKVAYTGPIKAPIRKGDKVAELIVSTPDTPPQIMPLVAGEDVGEAGVFGRLWNGLKSLFG